MNIDISPSSFEVAAMTPHVQWTLGGSIEDVRVAAPADARISEDRLEWVPGKTVNGHSDWWPEGEFAAKAVAAFFDLAASSEDEVIVNFVRRFGVLGLSEDGLPSCGNPQRMVGPPQCEETWHGWAVSWEPVAAYRYYAACAKAMLILGAALKHAPPAKIVDAWKIFADAGLVDQVDSDIGAWPQSRAICEVWQRRSGLTWEEWWEKHHDTLLNLYTINPASVAFNFTYDRDRYRQPITDAEFAWIQRQKYGSFLTQYWLGRAGLVPTVLWDDEMPRLGISVGSPRGESNIVQPPNSLFRLVATHLVAAACGSPNTAQCSECGQIYTSQRKVRQDQNHYCSDCQRTAPSRRTQRSRTRKARGLNRSSDQP